MEISLVFVLCRFIRSVGIVDMVSSRKFLEAAQNTEDNLLFYTVFRFFEQRNQKLRSNPRFQPGTFAVYCVSQLCGKWLTVV
jgi:hypothetical protein